MITFFAPASYNQNVINNALHQSASVTLNRELQRKREAAHRFSTYLYINNQLI